VNFDERIAIGSTASRSARAFIRIACCWKTSHPLIASIRSGRAFVAVNEIADCGSRLPEAAC
jgi:hypothetical protein